MRIDHTVSSTCFSAVVQFWNTCSNYLTFATLLVNLLLIRVRVQTRSRPWVHQPGLNNHGQPFAWDRVQQKHWKGSYHTPGWQKESEQTASSQSTRKYRCTRLVWWAPFWTAANPGPCSPCKRGDSTAFISYALLETRPWHLVEKRQGDKHRSAQRSKHPDPQTETQMFGPRLPRGWRTHPQGPSMWWAGYRDCGTKTSASAASKLLASTPTTGNQQPQTGPPGNRK